MSKNLLIMAVIFLALTASFFALNNTKESTPKLAIKELVNMIDFNGVEGFADLHLHMFSDLAFGGGWMQGSPFQSKSEIYRPCESESDYSFWLRFVRDKVEPRLKDFLNYGECLDPKKKHPNWQTLAHNQSWRDALEKAHKEGLSLVVISAVNNVILCKLIPSSRIKFDDCDDMKAVDRQIEAFKKFDAENEWIQLATTPDEARKIINDGKLAAILSIEVTNIFGSSDLEAEVKKYKEKGVSTFQLIHAQDNRYGGSAIYMKAMKAAQTIQYALEKHEFKTFDTYVDEDGIEKNNRGLTPEGKQLVALMMKYNIPIDLAHASEKMVEEAYSVTGNDHPIYISHGHFRDIMKPPRGTFEKASAKSTLDIIKKTGGIYGVRTTFEHTHKFPGGPVENDCQGSSKSFAQLISYGDALGVPMGLASDLNGFIMQTKPRFGIDQPKEPKENNGCESHPRLNSDFDETGLGEISQLDDLLADVEQMGLDTTTLRNSAEAYIQMWERAY